MKMIWMLALSLLCALPASARIGDTMDEVKRRYGGPLGVEGDLESPESVWTFQDGQYAIRVRMRKNRSVSEEFTRRDRRDFTLEEVRILLANSAAPGAAWDQVNPTTWRQNDWVATWLERALHVRDSTAGE